MRCVGVVLAVIGGVTEGVAIGAPEAATSPIRFCVGFVLTLVGAVMVFMAK